MSADQPTTSVTTTELKVKAKYDLEQNGQLPASLQCDVHFHGNPSGSVMTNLRPSLLMISPELASRITSVGIPVTLYLFPSFSCNAMCKM